MKAKNYVQPKKFLGQHFLTDLSIAKDIVDGLSYKVNTNVLEVGPGMGVLTNFLIKKNNNLKVIEIDRDSVPYLKTHFPTLEAENRIIEGDFLKLNFQEIFNGEFAVIGNFPYNISTEIIFKCLDNKELVNEIVGMFQKEVAERFASKEGSKTYGITSVLLQAFYDVEYLFTVNETVFNPPPKVKSGVIRFTRKQNQELGCDPIFFKRVVKMAFNQRRKTLKNALSALLPYKHNVPFLDKRAEQLSLNQFVELTNSLAN